MTEMQQLHHQNRQRILDAARECLLESGPGELSLREIARRSGYSPASLYEYFQNKDAILQALRDDYDGRLAEALETVPADLGLHDRLIALCITFIQYAVSNPQAYRLNHGGLNGGQASWERDAFSSRILPCFEEGVQVDIFKPHTGLGAREMAAACRALVQGLAGLQLDSADGDIDFDMLNLQALETFLTGLQMRM